MDMNVSMEAVEALKTLAQSLPETVEGLRSATQNLSGVYQDNASALGPHVSEIEEMIAYMNQMIGESEASVLEMGTKILSTASALEEFIATDEYSKVKTK